MASAFKTRVMNDLAQKHKGYEKQVDALQSSVKNRLKTLLFRYFYFHVLCFLLMAIEIGIFTVVCLRSERTFLPAFILSCFFLTFFSFLIVRLYLQSRKSEIWENLSLNYLRRVKELIAYQERDIRQQVLLATALQSLAVRLQDWEYELLQSCQFIIRSTILLRKLSCFCFWRDVICFRENLFLSSIDIHLKIVQQEPVNLKAHASLANAFVLLSGLYADPRKYPEFEGDDWIPESRYSENAQSKFRISAERAIEEFKILNDYFPGNSWVHTQLAYSYHDLQMPLEEIRQYEILAELKPDNEDIMFKLGILYFQQGMNSLGLRIYENLKKINYNKSQKLIVFYGSFFIY